MIILYNVVLLIACLVSLPLLTAKVVMSEKWRETFCNRWRFKRSARLPSQRPIWIHAVSVGEILAAVILVKKMATNNANRPMVLSASTLTGYQMARKLAGSTVASIVFFPYDLTWSVRKALRAVRPLVFVLVESDVWPNFLHEANRLRVPLILANGRISPRSFQGYKKISFFMKPVFSKFSAVCAQTEMDAERFVAIGAHKDRVAVTGNLKFDYEPEVLSDREIIELRRSMGVAAGARVLLAGSTHAGEEKTLLDSFRALKSRFSDLVLVAVPRDPGRARNVQKMFSKGGFPASMKTELDETDTPRPSDVIVVDTMGELRRLYAMADVVFVGKSLVNLGGQNPLEPAACKKPILFGPHMFNFALVARMLVEQGGAIEVANQTQLVKQVEMLLRDAKRRETVGAKAYQVLCKNQGAVEKTLDIVQRFL
jgi:3-deoxy-D-manno-octulosonic-acid transferase